MKRLMLDHFRRWGWLLAASAVLAFALGWCLATPADYVISAHSKSLNLVFCLFKVQSLMIEFSTMTVAMLTGAFLLLFDWQHAVVRALVPLPMTAAQIGRGWWLATVAVPAIASAALLFLGAETFCWFHPGAVFPAERLAIGCPFALVWPGIIFTGILLPRPGFLGTGRARTWALLSSLLSMPVMFFGMSLCLKESKHPVRLAIFFGVGACLTAMGWYRAGRFNPGGAGQSILGATRRPAPGRAGVRLTPLESRPTPPAGYGGIRFLIRTTFVRTFRFGLAMVALLAIVTAWRGQMDSRPQSIGLVVEMGSFFQFWIVVFQLMLVLLQLRFLRTLPLSATRLAAMLIAVGILPLVALDVLVAAAAGIAWGPPAAFRLLTFCALNLAPAVLCIVLTVGWGAGVLRSAFVLLAMVGFQMVWGQVSLQHPEIPFRLAGPIVALSVLLAFLAARHALLHRNGAYRVQPNPWGSLPWGRDA
ncbi:MAG: hypothetical protein ACLQVX_20600 [Limisphaerales bacterium]